MERNILHNQCSQISCLTDELTKLTRKLTTLTSRASERGQDTDIVFGFNIVLISTLTRTIQTLVVVLDLLLGVAGPEMMAAETAPDSRPNVWPDNLVELQSQFHSNP